MRSQLPRENYSAIFTALKHYEEAVPETENPTILKWYFRPKRKTIYIRGRFDTDEVPYLSQPSS